MSNKVGFFIITAKLRNEVFLFPELVLTQSNILFLIFIKIKKDIFV
jgi:hypothetical protein